MTEQYRFFDLQSYTESEFAEVESRKRRDGVLTDVGNRLAVTLGASSVSVDTGEAFLQGFWYKNDASKVLAIAANASATPRIDLVVLRLDRTTNTLTAVVHQGTVGGGQPAPTQIAGAVWEMILATVSTASSVSTLTDARTYSQTVWDAREVKASVGSLTVGSPLSTQQLTRDPSTELLQWAELAAARPNILHNGALRIDQKALGNVASGTILDRFYLLKIGALNTRGVNATLGAQYVGGMYTDNALEWFANAALAPGAGDVDGIYTTVEGYNVEQLIGQPVVFSAWFNPNVTTTIAVVLQSGGQDKSYIRLITLPANVWTFAWFTATLPTTGAYGLTEGRGLLLGIVPLCGSTYRTATPDTWVNGTFWGATGMSNNLTSNGSALYMIQPKLELGTYPTRFTVPDIREDLHNCYRHLWVVPTYVGAYADSVPGNQYSTAQVNLSWHFPVPMRAVPAFSCPGLTSIATVGGTAGAVHLENQRLAANMTGGTYSSHSSWGPGYKHFTTRLVSSTAFSGASGDDVYAYFGSGIKPTFSAELT